MKKAVVYLLFAALLMVSCGRSEKEEQQYIAKTMDSIKRATAIRDSLVLDSLRKDSYNTDRRRSDYNSRRLINRPLHKPYY